jgi:hypothetical protein
VIKRAVIGEQRTAGKRGTDDREQDEQREECRHQMGGFGCMNDVSGGGELNPVSRKKRNE